MKRRVSAREGGTTSGIARLASEREDERAVVLEGEARVVGDLPHVAVEVGEVPGVAAVEGLGGGFGDRRAGRLGGGEDRVDLLARAHVLGQGDAAEAVGGS